MSRLILCVLVGFMLVGCQKGPTDEQFTALMEKVHHTLMNKEQSFEDNDKQAADLLKEAGKEFDVMKTKAEQFAALTKWNTIIRSESVKNWIQPRLKELSTRKDKEGAVATYYSIVYDPASQKGEYTYETLQPMFGHPAMGELLKDDFLGARFFTLFFYTKAENAQKAELIKRVAPYINDDMAAEAVRQATVMYDNALEAGDAFTPEELDGLRTKLLAQNERVQALGTVDVSKNIAYLNSLLAQGKLIGSEAPAIDFQWISSGDAKSLADLKGNVVVVDFWATWCGPCVGSFPNVRELQKRYKGYPVKIIGVTSLQGRHINRAGDKRETIDTKGDPQKEYLLMKDFMKDMDMTWIVAFSEQNVFNPEYGVKGIPHVAIIDAEGRVRYNELRPYEAPFHEAEKIDALLKEAGLKYPAKPMEETNYVKF